ncbi:hypothetical protein GC176_27610 [bacterium]|nr:hypothetical protein [bacterium]
MPPSETSRTVDLSARDVVILDHIARYRISTPEVLHRLFFDGSRANAVTKVTSRLCDIQHLRRFPLYHPRTYFTLGPEAAKRLGLPVSRTRPLGPQSLPLEYGVLSCATRGQHHHQRLTTRELLELCPDLPAGLTEQPCCLDDSVTPPRLELIRVDLGGRPDHVARKCQADVRSRSDVASIQQLMAAGRFRLFVVTGTLAKAGSITDSLQQHAWPEGFLIQMFVVSDLLPLIAGVSDT